MFSELQEKREEAERQRQKEFLQETKERLAETRKEIEDNIKHNVDYLKKEFGLDLTEEEFKEKVKQEFFEEQKEKFLEDANRSVVSEEEKQKILSQIDISYRDRMEWLLEERKKYIGKTDEELRDIIINRDKSQFNEELIRTATKGNYEPRFNGGNEDWAKDKDTRTLVGEIKYIEFANQNQKQKRRSIRNEIANLAFTGLRYGITGGLAGIATGLALAFGADKMGISSDLVLPITLTTTTAIGAFLTPAIELIKRSKAFSLLKRMIQTKNKNFEINENSPEYSEYKNAHTQAWTSHRDSEDIPKEISQNNTYIEELGLTNAAIENAKERAAKSL